MMCRTKKNYLRIKRIENNLRESIDYSVKKNPAIAARMHVGMTAFLYVESDLLHKIVYRIYDGVVWFTPKILCIFSTFMSEMTILNY